MTESDSIIGKLNQNVPEYVRMKKLYISELLPENDWQKNCFHWLKGQQLADVKPKAIFFVWCVWRCKHGLHYFSILVKHECWDQWIPNEIETHC